MFQPKVENAEFISRVEHLLSKMEKCIPKSNTLILATYVFIDLSDVCIYRTNRKQFCLREHIETKNLGTKVSQKSKTH